MENLTFGDKLVLLRRKNNISQKKLASKLKIHVTNISRYEKNEYVPNHETLIKIAKLFNVSIDYLLLDNVEYREIININDTRLLNRAKKIDQLNEEDRNTIINVIDSMLAKHKLQHMGDFPEKDYSVA